MLSKVESIKTVKSYATMDCRGVPIVRDEIWVSPPAPAKAYIPTGQRILLVWAAREREFCAIPFFALIYEKHFISKAPALWKLHQKRVVVATIERIKRPDGRNYCVIWRTKTVLKGTQQRWRMKSIVESKAVIEASINNVFPETFRFK